MFLSCFSEDDNVIVASVHEEDLFLHEIIDQMPEYTKDSTYFVNKFIDDWIRKKLMVYYAEMNLNVDLLQYEKQVEDYTSSLLIYAYQQQLLSQNFDTLIRLSEIKDYYEKYKSEFQLNQAIFKGRFIIVDKSAPNLRNLDVWYKSEKEIEIDYLEDYCQQFAKEYYLDYNNWQYFAMFNKKLPNMIEDEDRFLKRKKSVVFEDDNFRYYIFLKDYQIKGSLSPLVFESDKIKNVLLNKKKIKYLQKLEDELYQNALFKKKIRIY